MSAHGARARMMELESLLLAVLMLASAVGAPAGGDYPITAVWMYGRSSGAAWDAALGQFGAQGGRTVWMFGTHLVRSNASAVRTASTTKECVVQGRHCVDVAIAAATQHGVALGSVFTLTASTQLSPAALTPCLAHGIGELHLPPGTKGGSKSEYWLAVVPRWEQQQQEEESCTMKRGGTVDIILIDMPNALYTPSPNDQLLLLLDATKRAGMDAIVPMPGFPHLPPPKTWSIDTPAMGAFLVLVQRTTTDLCMRGGTYRSLKGVYQSYESPISGSWADISYDWYERTAGVVHNTTALHCPAIEVAAAAEVTPTARRQRRRLQFAISPYWDVTRNSGDNITLAQSAAGIAAIAAQASIDIVAPQEGRGTGKSACYWEHQADLAIADVDPNLANYPHVDGTRSFREQFWASTTQLFRAARVEIDKANAQRAVPQELWMNLEAFEATGVNPCDGDTDRTNKTRVDRSLMFGAGDVDRVVSFMWDPYFACKPRGYGNTSLNGDIINDMQRPIMGVATLTPPHTAEVGGWGLCAADASVNVTWEPAAAAGRLYATVPVTECVTIEAGDGSAVTSKGSVILPFDLGSTKRGSYIGLRPSAGGKASNGEYAAEWPERSINRQM
jgi:hypothetical protein